jgi:hypothetical protein
MEFGNGTSVPAGRRTERPLCLRAASCNRSAIAAATHLASAGVPVKAAYSSDQGHTYTAGVQDVIAVVFPWLVDGDPRFLLAGSTASPKQY